MTIPTAGTTKPPLTAGEVLRQGIEGWVFDPLAKKLMLRAVNHIEQAEAALAEARELLGQLDEAVSRLHDVLYQVPEHLERDEVNAVVWTLHDRIRVFLAREQEEGA